MINSHKSKKYHMPTLNNQTYVANEQSLNLSCN
jgi:hypothetical protein